jgi:hypothetical protein
MWGTGVAVVIVIYLVIYVAAGIAFMGAYLVHRKNFFLQQRGLVELWVELLMNLQCTLIIGLNQVSPPGWLALVAPVSGP